MQHSLEQSSPDSSKESGTAAACGAELMDSVTKSAQCNVRGLNERQGIYSQEKRWNWLTERKGETGKGGLGSGRHQDGGRIGQGRVSRLSPQKAPHLCPFTELLQVVMHYIYFPINSIAHLTANLYSTFAIMFFLCSLRVGILGTGHLQHSRSFPHLWSTHSHLCNLLWQCTSPFIKDTCFQIGLPS